MVTFVFTNVVHHLHSLGEQFANLIVNVVDLFSVVCKVHVTLALALALAVSFWLLAFGF